MFETMKSKMLGAGLGLALVGSALGGVVMTGMTSVGAQTPTSTPATQSQQSATSDATDTSDANEPGGGHEDAPGTDVQHDFEGVE